MSSSLWLSNIIAPDPRPLSHARTHTHTYSSLLTYRPQPPSPSGSLLNNYIPSPPLLLILLLQLLSGPLALDINRSSEAKRYCSILGRRRRRQQSTYTLGVFLYGTFAEQSSLMEAAGRRRMRRRAAVAMDSMDMEIKVKVYRSGEW